MNVLGADHADRHLDQTSSFLSWEKYLGCTSTLVYSMPLQQPELGWTWQRIKPTLKGQTHHIWPNDHHCATKGKQEGVEENFHLLRIMLVHTPPFSSWEDATVLWGPGSARHHQNVRPSRLTTWSWSLTSSRSHWGCWRTPPSVWPARPSSPWQCRKQWRTLSDLRANDKWVGTNVRVCAFFLSLFSMNERGSNSACQSRLNKLGIRRKKHYISHWKPPHPCIM